MPKNPRPNDDDDDMNEITPAKRRRVQSARKVPDRKQMLAIADCIKERKMASDNASWKTCVVSGDRFNIEYYDEVAASEWEFRLVDRLSRTKCLSNCKEGDRFLVSEIVQIILNNPSITGLTSKDGRVAAMKASVTSEFFLFQPEEQIGRIHDEALSQAQTALNHLNRNHSALLPQAQRGISGQEEQGRQMVVSQRVTNRQMEPLLSQQHAIIQQNATYNGRFDPRFDLIMSLVGQSAVNHHHLQATVEQNVVQQGVQQSQLRATVAQNAVNHHQLQATVQQTSEDLGQLSLEVSSQKQRQNRLSERQNEEQSRIRDELKVLTERVDLLQGEQNDLKVYVNGAMGEVFKELQAVFDKIRTVVDEFKEKAEDQDQATTELHLIYRSVQLRLEETEQSLNESDGRVGGLSAAMEILTSCTNQLKAKMKNVTAHSNDNTDSINLLFHKEGMRGGEQDLVNQRMGNLHQMLNGLMKRVEKALSVDEGDHNPGPNQSGCVTPGGNV